MSLAELLYPYEPIAAGCAEVIADRALQNLRTILPKVESEGIESIDSLEHPLNRAAVISRAAEVAVERATVLNTQNARRALMVKYSGDPNRPSLNQEVCQQLAMPKTQACVFIGDADRRLKTYVHTLTQGTFDFAHWRKYSANRRETKRNPLLYMAHCGLPIPSLGAIVDLDMIARTDLEERAGVSPDYVRLIKAFYGIGRGGEGLGWGEIIDEFNFPNKFEAKSELAAAHQALGGES